MHGMGVDACAADMLVTRTWLHHKHHCRLLRVSAQVERSMGGGSAAPYFAEARWEVSGTVLRGLYDGLGHPKCTKCMRQTVKSWPKRQDCCVPKAQCVKLDGWNEAWRGLMLLHASWNGCQKPCCKWGWRLAAEIENSHLFSSYCNNISI